jgi:ubiquinone/menaquinone biosynthesis C-methylase UbiE
MPFESESSDVVVSSAAPHQMIDFGMDHPRILEETYRVLKPGGRLAVAEPMIGQRIAEKLQVFGFRAIKAHGFSSLGPVSPFMKMLSAVKVQ